MRKVITLSLLQSNVHYVKWIYFIDSNWNVFTRFGKGGEGAKKQGALVIYYINFQNQGVQLTAVGPYTLSWHQLYFIPFARLEALSIQEVESHLHQKWFVSQTVLHNPGLGWKLLTHYVEGLYCRAAQILGGFLPQTLSLSLTQTVTPYQFLGPYDIVLPRPESFEVGHFISILALKCPTSKLSCRGKMMS